MASRTGIRVEGLRETVRALERFGVDVEDLKEAFGSIARDVAADAAALVPVDSGALQASIRPAKTKNKAIVRAGTGTRVPYAGAINYGWPARGIPATEFLTGPANADPAGKAKQIDANLEALIRKYGLN